MSFEEKYPARRKTVGNLLPSFSDAIEVQKFETPKRTAEGEFELIV